MALRTVCTSILLLILLSTKIDASRHRSVRQAGADVCANPTGNVCLFINCENGGLCIQDSTTADCYKCQCAPGFTGKVCSTPTTLPTGCNPGCQNGGLCNVNVCLCPVGYTGLLCETRNYCLPNNPCQNGGRCTSNGVNYVCDCTSTGYTGSICTVPVITDPCASRPCENDGLCSSTGSNVNCLCVNGYTGTFCQIPPGPCAAAPCINGGQCELTPANTYACVCPADFTGNRCETSILENHPCVTSPSAVCLNGGVCTVNGADYLCKCAAGWSGFNCQVPVTTSSCNPNPCGIHGACLEAILPTGTVAYCNCQDRWTGKYCDVNMDVGCPIGYCLSGGVCRINGNVPQCDCPPLYTGERCQFFEGTLTTTTTTTTTPGVGYCFSNPCLNGGTCFANISGYSCACLSLFTGENCQFFLGALTTTTTTTPGVRYCFSNPCLNGGTCFENINGYICSCPSLYTGDQCQYFFGTLPTTTTPAVRPCSSNPCMNGGSCFNNGNSFVCACPQPWSGTICTSIGATITTTTSYQLTCTNQTCKNGGTCYNNGNSYYCFCGSNSLYTGTNCETIKTASDCPLNCAPGRCILSGSSIKPYACICNSDTVVHPTSCT